MPPAAAMIRERVELDDSDFLDLAFSPTFDTGGTGDIVAIFHGLAGSTDSSYIRGAFHALDAAGFRVAFMHFRGCSGEPNRLAHSYHAGATEDMRWFIDRLAGEHPDTPLHAIGYSLGGNALIKYLGEQGADTPLTSAVSVCPPLVIAEGAARMNRGLARGYQAYLARRMRAQHEIKRTRYPELELPPATPQAHGSFLAIDEQLTAPLHGFDSARDYYTQASARQFLPQVRIPLTVLCARDDPFFTPAIIPTAEELAPDTVLELSDYGGHVGFIDSLSLEGRWLDRRLVELVAKQRLPEQFATLKRVSP